MQCILSDVSRFVAEREQREAELEKLLKASEERYEIIRALGSVYQDISVIDLKAQRYTLVSGCGKSEQYQGSTGPSGEFRSFVLNEIIAPAQHEEAAVFLDFSTAADHLLSLINDVLQMSKLEDGKAVLTHEFISLIDLTQDIVSIIIGRAVEAGIEWDYEKGKSSIPYPYIYGSPVHLRQIFLNIYGNCIKYNRPGGKITTIVDVLEEHDGMCTYRWTIIDTGIGMSED